MSEAGVANKSAFRQILNSAGFTLAEMLISLVILSAVGLGAYSIIMGVTSSQKKLEQTLERGFNSFTYKPRNIPLQPLRLGFVNKLGWLRVPSVHAFINISQAQLDWLKKGTPTDLSKVEIRGDLVNREMIVSIVSDDARLEEPVWTKCESDREVFVDCQPFKKGLSSVKLTISERAQQLAIIRLQAAWPGIPTNHPYKRSPEYTIAIPLARDCDLPIDVPGIPKYLLHNGTHILEGSPNESGCIPTFKTYHCINGLVKVTDGERFCP